MYVDGADADVKLLSSVRKRDRPVSIKATKKKDEDDYDEEEKKKRRRRRMNKKTIFFSSSWPRFIYSS